MEKLGPGDPLGVPPGVQLWGNIGAYRLLARLGAGGMGQVYLARSDRGRTVAVKLVREELAEQEEFRARFRQEVLAARRVGGHWTAPVLDADTEAAVPWVATGYVAGPSLQQVVGHDHGALPERSVRVLAAGLAHALKDIHAAGIVHRDLKPSNVLVTIDGPRVIDFGIARALETAAGDGLTRTGSLVGSPGFMAPEQVRGDRITPACDVFCLGSVLAYAATGALPFGTAGSGAHAVMFRIAQEEPDLEGVPEGIADLVRDCLRKDPAARPTLDALLERTGAQDTVSGGRSRDPWLPGALVAQLGRHAVRLLDTEDPDGMAGTAGAAGAAGAGAGAGRPQAPVPDAAPHASPEHAPVSDDACAPPPPVDPRPQGQQDGSVPFNHLPTVAAGQTPPPGTPPPHPAYGHPQQHPQPAGYGHPPQSGPRAPYNPYAGYGPTPPYGPPPVGVGPRPPREDRRSTAVLVAVALVVALAAGGSVYALMRNGSQDTGAGTVSPSPTATSTPTTRESAPATTEPESPSASASDGAVPASFLGTWSSSIDNDLGHHTRELTVRQGGVGDPVLTLVADGPTRDGGTYHCVFQADLAEQPGDGGPLEIGPSSVTAGGPSPTCKPGAASEVTLLPDGRLRRDGSGGSLTYTKE